MISGSDIANGVQSGFAMARNEKGWQDRFDFSADQVFKSFWAILFALPGVLLAAEIQRQMAAANPVDPISASIASIGPFTLAVSQIISFSLLWGLELWILAALAKRRGIGWKISPLIISYNWSKFLFSMVLGLPLGVAILTGVMPLASIASILANALLLFMRWGIFRRTLDLTPMGTVGVLALVMLAYFLVSSLTTGMLSVFGLMELPSVGADLPSVDGADEV